MSICRPPPRGTRTLLPRAKCLLRLFGCEWVRYQPVSTSTACTPKWRTSIHWLSGLDCQVCSPRQLYLNYWTKFITIYVLNHQMLLLTQSDNRINQCSNINEYLVQFPALTHLQFTIRNNTPVNKCSLTWHFRLRWCLLMNFYHFRLTLRNITVVTWYSTLALFSLFFSLSIGSDWQAEGRCLLLYIVPRTF